MSKEEYGPAFPETRWDDKARQEVQWTSMSPVPQEDAPITFSDVRPTVRQFALEMELKLRQRDHRGKEGWRGATWRQLWEKLREEFFEVRMELRPAMREPEFGNPSFLNLAAEAVDLANMAMMIHDNASRAAEEQDQPIPYAAKEAGPVVDHSKGCEDCAQLPICNGELACACGPAGKMFIRKEPSIPLHPVPTLVEEREEWREAGLTPQQMWDEIQAIRKTIDDDGTHGSPSEALARRLAAPDPRDVRIEELENDIKVLREAAKLDKRGADEWILSLNRLHRQNTDKLIALKERIEEMEALLKEAENLIRTTPGASCWEAQRDHFANQQRWLAALSKPEDQA